ncbi:hypothetical protein [Streptomyces sp. 5-6(2022)]|uniref:hypothetical protein n=1 Tax=Streptomyces sp. 5-6(2022) TaxID=2936510 RepID=UPI0023BA27AB|nr:hypothetical protein [Streptomyces sp. 5-6(2022)]
MAKDSSNLPAEAAEAEGGGGGDLSSSEDQEQDKPLARAEAFVASLDYRGKQPGQTRRAKLSIRVAAAFKAGWTENGLRRYLDISDDPDVRSPASVYLHRLAEDELPEAADPEVVAELLPPACAACLDFSPSAEFNPRLRQRGGQQCPDCHPGSLGLVVSAADRGVAQGQALAAKYRRQEWGGTDDRVQGWLDLSRQLAEEDRTPPSHNAGVIARHRARREIGHKPYSNDSWTRMEQLAAAGLPPDGVERARHCGDPECNEITRYRERENEDGTKELHVCSKCHPAMRF